MFNIDEVNFTLKLNSLLLYHIKTITQGSEINRLLCWHAYTEKSIQNVCLTSDLGL